MVFQQTGVMRLCDPRHAVLSDRSELELIEIAISMRKICSERAVYLPRNWNALAGRQGVSDVIYIHGCEWHHNAWCQWVERKYRECTWKNDAWVSSWKQKERKSNAVDMSGAVKIAILPESMVSMISLVSFSEILPTLLKFEIGRKFESSDFGRPGFFRRGEITIFDF